MSANRLHNDRGAIYLFAVMIVIVLLLAAGLVVDLGQQRAAARDTQADADVIALDMARLVDGTRKLSHLQAGGQDRPLVERVLTAAAQRNAVPGSVYKDAPAGYSGLTNIGKLYLIESGELRAELQWGEVTEQQADATCTGPQFQTNDEAGAAWFTTCGDNDGERFPNAAMVSAYDDVGFVLLPVGDGPSRGGVVRTAIARQGDENLVSFRIGSYLLDGVGEGVLDDLFTELLGSSVDLQAVHYDGLLLHEVTIRDLAELSGVTGSPSELLDQEITFQDLAEATVAALRRDGDGTLTEAQITAIESVFASATVIATEPIRLGDLVEADPTDPNSALDAQLNALDVLQTGAHLAQCSQDSAGNWDCHSVMFDNLAADLAGIATVSAPVTTVTESPRVYVGNEIGATLQTSQISTAVDLDFTSTPDGQSDRCGLLGLNCLLSDLLGTLLGEFASIALLDVNGTVSIDLVGGAATIQDLCYNSPSTRDLDLVTKTSLYEAEARIDVSLEMRTLLGATKPVTLSLIMSNSDPTNSQDVTFTDPTAMGPVTLGGGSVGLSGLDVAVEIDGTPLTGGLADLQPLWDKLIDDLLEPTVNDLAGTLTNIIAPRVDELVGDLSDRLGINLTGADLEGLFNRCGDYGVQLVG